MDEVDNSYAQTPMLEPFMYCSIPDRLRYHAKNTPDKAAFIIHSSSGDRNVYTCEEIFEQSLIFAKGLVQLGIEKGDTIGLAFHNSLEWIVSTFGIQMAGGIPLYMSYKYKDGRDIIQVLQISKNCKALIMDYGKADLLKNIVDFEAAEFKSNCLPSLKFVALNKRPTFSKGCMLLKDISDLGQK